LPFSRGLDSSFFTLFGERERVFLLFGERERFFLLFGERELFFLLCGDLERERRLGFFWRASILYEGKKTISYIYTRTHAQRQTTPTWYTLIAV
jgi:hypothetical protein